MVWQEKLQEVRQHAQQDLNQMEVREFQTRINVLQRELDDKNREIEQVTRERQLIAETTERVNLKASDIKDQAQEI